MRSTFTRAFNNLKEEIKKDDCNLEDCQVNLYSLQNTLELKSFDKISIEYGTFDNKSVSSKPNSGSEIFKKRFKLPSIEFDKFCGDLKDWL